MSSLSSCFVIYAIAPPTIQYRQPTYPKGPKKRAYDRPEVSLLAASGSKTASTREFRRFAAAAPAVLRGRPVWMPPAACVKCAMYGSSDAMATGIILRK